METSKRYPPFFVALHWLVALLVLTNLILGYFVLDRIRNFALRNTLLGVHMAVGITILLLMAALIVLRVKTGRPARLSAGNAFLDFLAKAVHYALYFFVIAMTVVGLAYSIQSRQFEMAFLGTGGPQFAGQRFGGQGFSGTPFPGSRSFNGTPQPGAAGSGPRFTPGSGTPGPSGSRFNGRPGSRDAGPGFFSPLLSAHILIASILLVLLGLHILGALYHQVVRKDRLLGRMWFGSE